MIKDYKITGKLIPGSIYLRYEQHQLTAVAFELNGTIVEEVWNAFCQRLRKDDNVKYLSESFEVKELNAGKSVQDKIVLFCSAYKHFRQVPYKPKELEKANVKNVPVTRELLEVFFGSPLANYTLDNYIKRINITRDWAKNGMNNHLLKAKPDEYDAEYERTLDGPALSDYWQHLRANGWEKDDRGVWKRSEK